MNKKSDNSSIKLELSDQLWVYGKSNRHKEGREPSYGRLEVEA